MLLRVYMCESKDNPSSYIGRRKSYLSTFSQFKESLRICEIHKTSRRFVHKFEKLIIRHFSLIPVCSKMKPTQKQDFSWRRP